MSGKLFVLLEKYQIRAKTVCSTFLATFGEIGLLSILPTGHTDCEPYLHMIRRFFAFAL